jgi:prepilin-type processing-associated H-X9-DG protein
MLRNSFIRGGLERVQFPSGSTLIELMVAVGILGTMAGLLLPAVQRARETARSNGCRHNLKQIGVALLNFEAAHRHFPKGAEGRFDPKLAPVATMGVAWWPDVLPYLGESAIADQLDRTGVWTGWALLNSHNGNVANGFAPAFWFCPSSTIDHSVKVGNYQVATPSYVGISGATMDEVFSEARVSPSCCNDGKISAGGILIPNAVVCSKQVTDGLSKTMVVAEQSDFVYWQEYAKSMRIDGGYLRGWLAGTYGLGVPPNYGTPLTPTYNVTTVRYPLNERSYDLPGIDLDHGANNPLVSPHPHTVNLLYCDGSVHTAEDTMDIEVLKSAGTRDDGTVRGE